jgi:hypothetical protein
MTIQKTAFLKTVIPAQAGIHRRVPEALFRD